MRANILAPVALFVYNRPKHTQLTLESLKKNKLAAHTMLYIFADGEKSNASEEDKKNIIETRELIAAITGFKEVIVNQKTKNHGLAASIIAGVTQVVNRHKKIIVLEDDLIVADYFLDYMNDGLNAYEAATNVFSINAFMFPLKTSYNKVVLLPYTSTWGWATWKTKWDVFDEKMIGKELLYTDKKLAKRFNLGDYKYTDMLNLKNNSWGIKWYYSVFMKNGLNLFPHKTLVANIGFDGSGTNCGNIGGLILPDLYSSKIDIKILQKTDLYFLKTYIKYFTRNKIKAFVKKTINTLKTKTG